MFAYFIKMLPDFLTCLLEFPCFLCSWFSKSGCKSEKKINIEDNENFYLLIGYGSKIFRFIILLLFMVQQRTGPTVSRYNTRCSKINKSEFPMSISELSNIIERLGF
jgi:hypothetical protein